MWAIAVSEEHSRLGTEDEVAPGAEDVMAVDWVYATAALIFWNVYGREGA
jgi:hypothetical protein